MANSGWKLNNPLFDSLPKAFDKATVQTLLDFVHTGNIEYKDELILNLLSICKIIINKKLYKNTELQRNIQDLLGELTLQTCIWVDDLSKQRVSCQPTPEYYWEFVKRKIADFNAGDINPNLSGNWLRKLRTNGSTAPVRIRLRDELLFINPTVILDLEDILITLAETSRESELIILRFQGYNDSEIATVLGVDKATVCRIRLLLEQRYNDYLQLSKGKEE